jgi:hypothetical protein
MRSGIVGGMKMNLDLRYQTQIYVGLYEREIYSAGPPIVPCLGPH